MDKIEELLTRGVDKVYPTKEELAKILQSGKKLRVYQGFDPTGPQLHIGHMMGLRKLRQWQDLGHDVIFLVGDFTGTIGDPSGKTTERIILTRDEVLENAKTYKEQAGKILRFDGDNPVKIKFNGDWLNKMSYMDFIKISRNLSVNQVLERDLFQERLKRQEDIYMNEFSYPVMQAYDSVAMNIDLEIGGTDQMFNMLMGRKLMRNMLKKEKFVMTTPLLTDSEGRKIGKTEGNVIALSDKAEDFYAKIMGLPDDIIIKGFEYLTDIPMNEVKVIEKKLEEGEHPMPQKKRLAYEIVKQLNTEEEANNAAEAFEKIVQQNELPSDILTVKLSNTAQNIVDVLVETNLASSKTDAKRLIEQGGVEVDGKKVTEATFALRKKESLIQVGKRRFIKVKMV